MLTTCMNGVNACIIAYIIHLICLGYFYWWHNDWSCSLCNINSLWNVFFIQIIQPMKSNMSCLITSKVLGCNTMTDILQITFLYPRSTKLKEVMLVSHCLSVCLSICPFVYIIMCAMYLPKYLTDPFHIYTSNQTTSESVLHLQCYQNLNIWSFDKFFEFLTLTLSCFDLGSNMNQLYW